MKIGNMCSIMLAVLVLSTAVVGQDTPKREGDDRRNSELRQLRDGGRPDMAGAMGQRMPLMMALDADQDGTISASEIENASKSLAKLDKDGNGVLSVEEIRPDFSGMTREGQPGPNGTMGKEMMARMFDERDADKDGKLSGDEIPERIRQNVARVDENGDGAIDKSEMEKIMARMGDRAGRSRGATSDKDGAGVKPKRPPTE